ncbi:hypothetical protein HMPREF0973_02850 [Prevotella veroralis F0319]|uniref:Uncharacterized protein n=1 Tax=Prevotella veroralis F0319 TaxID=649761 RepID=C9MT79_9BACT|nr:hypothetical protein HMPREF0973_02850 [Prevotella veroralis F0319]
MTALGNTISPVTTKAPVSRNLLELLLYYKVISNPILWLSIYP